MPRYDYSCTRCNKAHEVSRPLRMFRERIMEYCPDCDTTTYQELVLTAPAVDDWGNDGAGRFIEDLAPNGIHFPDKRSYKRYLREHGLVEWSPKTGMPGSGV